MMYPIHRGVPIVLLPRFEPKLFLGAIERYRATVMIIAPPILMFFQNAPVVEEYDLSSLRSIISVAAPASKALIENSTNRLVSLGANGRSFGP